MIKNHERGFKALVELSDYNFWKIFNKLKIGSAEFQKRYDESDQKIFLRSITIDGREYFFDQISEALDYMKRYISESGVNSSDYDLIQARREGTFNPADSIQDFMDDLAALNSQAVNRITHPLKMEIKLWHYILDISGMFEQVEDHSNEEDDWVPPDNFENGTSDEQEIWNDLKRAKS